MTDEPKITTAVIAAQMTVSSELLDGGFTIPWSFAFRELTPAEKAERKARQERERAERTDRQTDALARLDGPVRAIAALHAPGDYGDCEGCGGDEYGTEWPCGTWTIAAGEEA